MIVSIQSFRKLLVLALALLVLGGCGGDDEPTPPATQEGTVSEETTATSESETTAVDPETETLPNDGDGTGTGESGQGGAGDEQAAETLALFTGENGAIAPPVVRVPAFISVRVELRSADGGAYELTFGDKRIEVGDGLTSRSTTFEGLRPGAKLVGTGTGGKVRIEATAEPGP
jgi:ABC-type transport system substrate-binding protein